MVLSKAQIKSNTKTTPQRSRDRDSRTVRSPPSPSLRQLDVDHEPVVVGLSVRLPSSILVLRLWNPEILRAIIVHSSECGVLLPLGVNDLVKQKGWHVL